MFWGTKSNGEYFIENIEKMMKTNERLVDFITIIKYFYNSDKLFKIKTWKHFSVDFLNYEYFLGGGLNCYIV